MNEKFVKIFYRVVTARSPNISPLKNCGNDVLFSSTSWPSDRESVKVVLFITELMRLEKSTGLLVSVEFITGWNLLDQWWNTHAMKWWRCKVLCYSVRPETSCFAKKVIRKVFTEVTQREQSSRQTPRREGRTSTKTEKQKQKFPNSNSFNKISCVGTVTALSKLDGEQLLCYRDISPPEHLFQKLTYVSISSNHLAHRSYKTNHI